MAALLIVLLLAFLYITFAGSGSSGESSSSGRSNSCAAQQRWADEFEMDSYDDEQHWGNDD